jgi:hypothetical protein
MRSVAIMALFGLVGCTSVASVREQPARATWTVQKDYRTLAECLEGELQAESPHEDFIVSRRTDQGKIFIRARPPGIMIHPDQVMRYEATILNKEPGSVVELRTGWTGILGSDGQKEVGGAVARCSA